MRISVLLGVIVSVFLLTGCGQDPELFKLVKSDQTGIHFSNTLPDSLNAIEFEYLYNGAGVGVADFNNDGFSDIFFAGNVISSALYLNKGNFIFKDVSDVAGIKTHLWCTGVAIVDINQDGLLDIYISTVHPKPDKKVPNIFFINQGLDDDGTPHFKDMASILNLADSSYSSQAVFLDYDLDGDLDMYLLTNALENYPRNATVGQRTDGSGKSVDKLFRQEMFPDGTIHFTDVSMTAGIKEEGWGLGVVVNDFNQDGWPDIYCANDFLSSDHLYINQQDGTFRNEIAGWMNHQEFNGMGADIADLNNDALNDLVVVDMMPDDNLRQKTMFSGMGYDRFMKSLKMNYQPQYIRNVLQRNNGNNTFSDIGYMSGIYATDWSWSPLIADFDNDGLRDIFITNGYPKDITDLDFVTYNKDVTMFGTDNLKRENAARALKGLGGVHKPNFLFHNNGNFKFENVTATSGLNTPSYSNGAAYADLDNDGDLDLVINNLSSVSQVYKNTTNPLGRNDANYLQVRLQGDNSNRQAIGAKVWVYCNRGEVCYCEQQLQRGYLSSVDPTIHVGLGSITRIDSVVVVWPDKKTQTGYYVPINSVYTASIEEAKPAVQHEDKLQTIFIKESILPSIIQPEDEYVDYKYAQRTLPHKFSQQGPRLAVGDINGDGLEDFVEGGTANHGAYIFYQEAGATFRMDSLMTKESEDAGLCLFDADNDGDLDLYCVSGSSEFGTDESKYQDRFYRNDGKGHFELDKNALPKIVSSGSCVIATDFDKDGDQDLFVGGRVAPTLYPLSPKSYFLQNDGKGNFKDVTNVISQGLDSLGMVTCAIFTDFNNDDWKDLIVAGEWMPITIFRNEKGKFTKTAEFSTGWWTSLAEGDFDKDGDMDYLVGNYGRNTIYQVSENEPISVYAKDFDGNGSMDPIISRFISGKEYPVHYRETMTDQIAGLRKILTSYSQFGKMEMRDIINYLGSKDVIIKRASCFESSYLQNMGDGNFTLHSLPWNVQASPLNSILVLDINNDSKLDFLAVENSFSEEPLSGYCDAGIGICALGRGDGTFEFLSPRVSGFFVRTDSRSLVEIHTPSGRKWIVSSNQTPLMIFGEKRILP